MSGILFFIFASCEPLTGEYTQVFPWCIVLSLCYSICKNQKYILISVYTEKRYFYADKACLTAHNWQNEKEYSWHVPVIKFIDMKQLV